MSKVRIKLNTKGVGELLKGQDMQNALSEIAEGIKQRAGGDGYEVSNFVGRKRANASVVATTQKAIIANNENNTILKSLR